MLTLESEAKDEAGGNFSAFSVVRWHGRSQRAPSQKPLPRRALRSRMTLLANSIPFCNRRSSSALP